MSSTSNFHTTTSTVRVFILLGPARKIGSRPITPIPNEIYLEIFDYVEYDPEKSRVASKRLLSSLALVCRFFCAMALPRIFKSLEFSGPAYSGDNSAPSHASFCRAIIKGQEPAASLARHVNECIFDSWRVNSDETRWVYDGFLGIYSQAIGRMPNIRQVTLSDTEIDRRLFKVVCSLKNLESLTISKCVFGDDVTDSFLRKITPLKIKSFTLSSTSTREHSAKNLSYMVSAECLEHLRSDAWPVTSKLLLGVDQNILVHLDVTGGYCLALYSLLNRSPRLETLLVNDVSDTNIESDEIAANYDSTVLMTSCRNLHTLKCPPSMVDLVAGRPLHTVMVTGVDYRRDPILPMGVTDVALLKKSTTNIRELHIPLHLYFSVSIYEHFQTLEVLSIMYSHMNYLGLKPDTPTTSVHFKKVLLYVIL